MQVKPLGRLILFILFAGLVLGGYRFYQNRSDGQSGSVSLPSLGGGANQQASRDPAGGANDTDDTSASGNSGGGVELVILTSASKNDWLQEQINKFNAANTGKYHVSARLMETRDAFQALLNDKEKPALWSPSSPIWAARLAEVWPQKHGDQQILDVNDDQAVSTFLRTPIVFLTTKAKARYLRPALEGNSNGGGGQSAWAALRDLSQGRKKTPSGSFRFAYADPVTSNSGFLTLGLILLDYANRTGQAGDLNKVAADPRFFSYLAELHRGFVFDQSIDKGTSVVTNAFASGVLRCDLITTYESNALAAAQNNPNLAVIYPNPTAVAEQTVCALSAPFVSDEQRAGARAFLSFLGGRDAQRDGLKYHFRPVRSGALPLAELGDYADQGFRSSFASVELPAYQALNAAAYQWRVHVARRSAALR